MDRSFTFDITLHSIQFFILIVGVFSFTDMYLLNVVDKPNSFVCPQP